MRGEHVRDGFLGGGLAGRSGDADQRLAPKPRTAVASVCKATRCLDRQQQSSPDSVPVDPCARPPRRRLLQRLRHEVVAIEALAFDGEEKFPGLNGARIDGICLATSCGRNSPVAEINSAMRRERQLHALCLRRRWHSQS